MHFVTRDKERVQMIQWKNREHENTKVNRKGEVVYLTFPRLEETGAVLHGFTTRLGGVSKGDCSSMNLSFSRGDEEAAVYENYRRIAEAVGFSSESVVCSDQTHTTNVRRVGKEEKGCGLYSLVSVRSSEKSGGVVPFRLEGNNKEDWKSDGGSYGTGIWFQTGGYSCGDWSVHLSGLL